MDDELRNSGRIPDPRPEHTALFRGLAKILTAVEGRLRARGGRPLRTSIRVFWAFVAIVGLFLLFGPIINKPLDFDDIIDSADISEVDWIARDAQFDYRVGTADDGTFEAQVDEQFTAHFPNGPESRIERAFVTEYHGHDTRFDVHEATIDGAPADISVTRGAATTTVVITRADGADFDGEQRVAMSYELHDLVVTEPDDATGRDLDRWAWPLFAPAWPQATSGVEVSVTLSHEVNEALVRAPRAYVGWLLVGGSAWLEPDGESSQGVRYSFSNDDNLPPNAELNVTASFEPGTFAQPPTTPMFWVQTYGPLLPLALLGVLLLFSLAARRIVWADSAGDPWYAMRSEPPDELEPEAAAQLLGSPRHGELVSTLGRGPRRQPGAQWLRAVARAARRAGRIGNAPSALRWSGRWAADDVPVKRGLRWVPDSYVRDTFVFAPIAVTLLQWGLLRQLSHQVILSVVWWPALFVLVSTLLALATVLVVRRPRPLTGDGARLVQQLRGIDAYARTTRLLDRGPVDDPVLPYAVLFERPRRAGRAVEALAAQELGKPDAARGWRTEHFLSLPSLCALAAAVAVFAGSVVVVSTQPPPYERAEPVTRFDDLPGTLWSQVEGFEIEAELGRGSDGGARLEVAEHHRVRFTPGGASVPQFAREWPAERLGQDLGLEVESMHVDGEEVLFRESREPNSLAVVTQFEEVLDGLYDVEVEYSLDSPVVETSSDGDAVQQLRWTALYTFWEDFFYSNADNPFDGREPVRPLRLQFALAPELVDEVRAGGWIEGDSDRPRIPNEHGNWFGPWSYEELFYTDAGERYDIRVGAETVRDDGARVYAIDVEEVEMAWIDREMLQDPAVDPEDVEEVLIDDEDPVRDELDKYALSLRTDLGVQLDFAPDTFSGVEPGASGRYWVAYQTPYTATLALGAVVTGAAAGVFWFARKLRRRPGLSLLTVSFGALPLALIGQSVLFGWAVGFMPGSDGRIPGAVTIGSLMFVAVIGQAIMVGLRLRSRPGGDAAGEVAGDAPDTARRD